MVEQIVVRNPRFMTDSELREFFGLSERALSRLRNSPLFPRKDALINKTDRRAVEVFFDRRSKITSPSRADNPVGIDGEENFG